MQSFIELVDKYEIVPEEERALFDRRAVDAVDYSKRRELKIKQYKKEKELRARIEVTLSWWYPLNTMIDLYSFRKLGRRGDKFHYQRTVQLISISYLLSCLPLHRSKMKEKN